MSSHRVVARGASERQASAGGGSVGSSAATAQIKADVARFFVDLRRTIGASPPQIAAQLRTNLTTITALEQGRIADLPAWPETQRVVMGYAAWAGIDGRPVLTALAILAREAEQTRQTAQQAEAVRPAVNASAERLRHMQFMIAEGARRIQSEAMMQARERPVRTFYALSLPLGIVLVLMNANVLSALVSYVPGPFISAVGVVRDVMAVNFAPHREGLRWIEVTDPRQRRADKLPPPER